MSKLKIVTALLASFCLFFLFAKDAHATHFRYGNITYTVPDQINSPTTVRFDVIVAWRTAYIDSINLNFGDGQQSGLVTGSKIGEGVDTTPGPDGQYTVQRYTVTHTYPAPGLYTPFFTSCCRISELTDAGQHDQSFRVWAVVDLTPGNKGNVLSALPPIFQLQTGGQRTIQIPAIDPDGVPVHCRFGTPAETSTPTMPASIPGGALPTLSDTPTGCTLNWNTTNAVHGQKYALSVVIESLNGTNKSETVLDFIIELVSSPPPSCSGGGVFNVDLGNVLDQTVTGTNVGGGQLKMTTIGTFGNVSPVPGTTQMSPFSTTYHIAPSYGDTGVGILTILYTNPTNLSGFCTMAINVPPCPAFGNPCSTGVGACASNGYQYCQAGATLCSAVAGQPSPEKCDMIDNNCDGSIDEGDPETGDACVSSLPGACSVGTALCNAGVLECIPDVMPGTIAETCDGADQNCDGVVDDGFNIGSMCLKGDGQCLAAGKLICDGMGGVTCDAQPGPPQMETCNDKDDDCDQVIDNGFPKGMPCTVGTGSCETAGVIVCGSAGGTTCDAVPGAPGAEVCGNMEDEDCDGALNNGCDDADADGLYDPQEILIGTDPNDADTDDDGVPDGEEKSYDFDTDGDGIINALDPDSDNDGLTDGAELGKGCDGPDTDKAAGNCVADADPNTTTDPLSPDSDNGGATDGSEDANLDGKVDSGETDPSGTGDDDQVKDSDLDGLGDDLEVTLGTSPNDKDTDDDGLFDGLEPNPTLDSDKDGLVNVLDVDSDNDALFDGLEAGKNCDDPDTGAGKSHCHFDGDPDTTTSVLLADTDHGSVRDGSEDYNRNGVVGTKETNPNDPSDDTTVIDADGDGLSDALEKAIGSNPNDRDSDDDGVLDGVEANPSDDADGDGQPNLLDPDADADGLFDGLELGLGCGDADTDAAQSFCTPDGDNGATKTNPLLSDTDKGGVQDGEEDKNKSGVVDLGETDPNNGADDVLPECATDADCGASDSGRVCDQQKCVEGCRAAPGNGCPSGQMCSSTNDVIGTCTTGTGMGGNGGGGGAGGDGGVLPGGGCGCRASDDTDAGSLGVLALVGLAAIAATRRRRR